MAQENRSTFEGGREPLFQPLQLLSFSFWSA